MDVLVCLKRRQKKSMEMRILRSSCKRYDVYLLSHSICPICTSHPKHLPQFDPLEISPIEKSETCEGIAEPTRLTCLAKLVCLKKEGALSILGIHFVGPNAGEVIQGLSLAVTLGVDKKDLDNLIGIHPTMAEVFTNMETTLRSGSSYKAGGGCGGGKCG